MKNLKILAISCSLLLAGVLHAQQNDDQSDPRKKKSDKREAHDAGGKLASKAVNESKRQAPAPPKRQEQSQAKQSAKPQAKETRQVATERQKPEAKNARPAPAVENRAPQKSSRNPAAEKPAQTVQRKPAPRPADVTAKQRETNKRKPAKGDNVAKAEVSARNAQGESANRNPRANSSREPQTRNAKARRPDPEKIVQIKKEHRDFRAQPRPDRVPSVTYNQTYRIEGSDRWQGRQYDAFRSYRPERHDERWYHSRYDAIVLIGGGYYYQNEGYWYPAWGYRQSAEYYPYDGPIYAGSRRERPDRVIADVQAALQPMGYYQGDVDGLLGPLTRTALSDYQNDQGLEITAAIDEPTLVQLGLN